MPGTELANDGPVGASVSARCASRRNSDPPVKPAGVGSARWVDDPVRERVADRFQPRMYAELAEDRLDVRSYRRRGDLHRATDRGSRPPVDQVGQYLALAR